MEQEIDIQELRIELTESCNLRCEYCCVDRTAKHQTGLEHVLKAIDDTIPFGLKRVSCTGGEPFLEFDTLKEIISYAKSRNLETGVLTNATLASDERIKELKDIGLDWARISIDGPEEINDNIRGKGTYKKIVDAVRKFKDAGISVRLKPTILSTNKDYIDDLVKIALDTEVDRLEFQDYIPLGDEKKDSLFLLSPHDKLPLAKKLLELKKHYKDNLDIVLLSGWFEYLLDEYEGIPKPYFCGRNFLYIDVNDNVKTCAPNKVVLGNLKKESISNIITNSKILHDLRGYDASRYCPDCRQAKYCKPCPSPIINYFGTPNGPSPKCPDWKRKKDSRVYFEDLAVGDQWVSALREPITSEEVTAYMALTGEQNMMHSKLIYAPGYLLFQTMGALIQKVSARKDQFFNKYGARLLNPVVIGEDRFYVKDTIIDKVDKGSKNRGYVLFKRDLIKENEEIAVQANIMIQVAKKPITGK